MVDTATGGLDLLEPGALVDALVMSQRAAFDAVAGARASIASAVDEISRRLENGGCLHYFGAGTSGRIATLDAAEMPPTFGTAPNLVQAHIA
jgi:N-acetylmuramic acid 6-phosphate etherase